MGYEMSLQQLKAATRDRAVPRGNMKIISLNITESLKVPNIQTHLTHMAGIHVVRPHLSEQLGAH